MKNERRTRVQTTRLGTRGNKGAPSKRVCRVERLPYVCVYIYIYGESTWAEEEEGGKTSFFFLFATFDFEEDEVKWS